MSLHRRVALTPFPMMMLMSVSVSVALALLALALPLSSHVMVSAMSVGAAAGRPSHPISVQLADGCTARAGDMASGDLRSINNVETSAACADYCYDEPQCVGWVWVETVTESESRLPAEFYHRCFLKHQLKPVTPLAGVVHGGKPAEPCVGVRLRPLSASLSSEYRERHLPASHIMDGKRETFAHTSVLSNVDPHPWIELDFGAVYKFDRVRIINRQDCCQDRINNFAIIVGNVSARPQEGTIVYQETDGHHEKDEAPYLIVVRLSTTFSSTPHPPSGRYLFVRQVQLPLNLAEIEVWGHAPNGGPANHPASTVPSGGSAISLPFIILIVGVGVIGGVIGARIWMARTSKPYAYASPPPYPSAYPSSSAHPQSSHSSHQYAGVQMRPLASNSASPRSSYSSSMPYHRGHLAVPRAHTHAHTGTGYQPVQTQESPVITV